jgi:hypothetical protein
VVPFPLIKSKAFRIPEVRVFDRWARTEVCIDRRVVGGVAR